MEKIKFEIALADVGYLRDRIISGAASLNDYALRRLFAMFLFTVYPVTWKTELIHGLPDANRTPVEADFLFPPSPSPQLLQPTNSGWHPALTRTGQSEKREDAEER